MIGQKKWYDLQYIISWLDEEQNVCGGGEELQTAILGSKVGV